MVNLRGSNHHHPSAKFSQVKTIHTLSPPLLADRWALATLPPARYSLLSSLGYNETHAERSQQVFVAVVSSLPPAGAEVVGGVDDDDDDDDGDGLRLVAWRRTPSFHRLCRSLVDPRSSWALRLQVGRFLRALPPCDAAL